MLINVEKQKKEFMRKFHIHALIYNTVLLLCLCSAPPPLSARCVLCTFDTHTVRVFPDVAHSKLDISGASNEQQ